MSLTISNFGRRAFVRIFCLVVALFPLGAWAQSVLTTNLAYTPITIGPGDNSVMTIYFVNNTSGDATNLAINSTLPSGLQIVDYDTSPGPNGEINCGGTQSGKGGASGGSYGLSGATIPGIHDGQAGICVVKYLVTSFDTTGQTYSTTLEAAQVSATIDGTQVNAAADASNSLTVQTVSPLTGDKNFSPTTVATGAATTLTININNPNNFVIDGVAYTDNLPGGMTVLANPTATTSGCGSATLSATSGGASVGLSNAAIASSSTCTVVVSVQAPGTAGAPVNTIPAGSVTSTHYSSTAATTSDISATLSVQDQLTVSKSFASDTVFVDGSPTTMTITIANPTPDLVTSLAFNDVFPGTPAGFALDASAGGTAPIVSDSCGFTNTGATVIDGATELNVSGGSVAANGTCSIVVWVRGENAGGWVNSIGAGTVTGLGGASGTSPTANGNQATAPLNVSDLGGSGGTGGYAFGVQKYLSATPWVDGNPLSDSLTVGRSSDATTPVAYIYIQIINTQTTSAVSLTTLNDVLNSAGFTNIAGLSLQIDPNTIAGQITIGQYAEADNAIQTCSLGTVTATGSTATTLNLQFTGASIPAAIADPQSGTISPGRCILSFPVYLDSSAAVTDSLGTYHDAIAAGAVKGSVNIGVTTTPVDGDASNPVTLTVTGGVTIGKAFYASTVGPNGVSDLKISLTNANAVALTGVSFMDPLPAGLQLAGGGNPIFSADCGAAVLGSTTTAGATTLTVSGASVPQATGTPVQPGTCVLDVRVQQASGEPLTANYVNTIPVGSLISDQGISNNESSNTATLTVTPISVALAKSFNPPTVSAGQTSIMTIVVSNPQTDVGATLSNVTFDDAFPVNLVTAPDPNIQVACTADSTGAASNVSLFAGSPLNLHVSGIALAPSGSCTITLGVQLTNANTPVTNTIFDGTVKTTEGATNLGDAQATIIGIPGSAVTKSIAPSVATIGQPVTATIRISNNTNGAISGFSVLDKINPPAGYPAGVVSAGYLAPPNATWQIVAGSVALATNSTAGCVLGSNTTTAGTPNDQTQLTAITVPANAFCDVTYQLVGSAVGQYRNAILQANVVGGPHVCINNQNPCFTSADLQVIAPGSISVTKQVSGGTPAAGAQWTFTLVATDGCSIVGVTSNPLLLAAGAPGSFGNVPPVQGDGTTACHYNIIESGGDTNFVLAPADAAALQNLSVASGANLAVTALNTFNPNAPKPLISIAKTTTATQAMANGTINYVVTVSNAGIVDASGTMLADALPAGVASASWTCAANGGAQCPSARGSGAITQTIALFPIGSSVVYNVTAQISAAPPATIVNTATVTPPSGGSCSNGTPPCSSSVTTPVINPDPPQINITKTAAETTLSGGTIHYTVTVRNSDSVDAAGTLIGDPLPAGISAMSWTCTANGGATCPHASGNGAINETVSASFPAAANLVYAIVATLSATPPASVVNVASGTPPNGGQCFNGQTPPCTATSVVPPAPAVGISKSAASVSASASGTLVYTVIATNSSDVDAAGSVIADTLPAGIASATWTCAGNAGASCPNASGGGAIAQTIATFPAGSSLVYTVTAIVAAAPPTNIVNTATVAPPSGGVCADASVPPCSATVTTPIVQAATRQVGIVKTASSATLQGGGQVLYTVTASNTGTVAADGSLIADPLAPGIASANWTCAASGGATCPIASGSGAINQTISIFPAGASVTYTITAQIAATATTLITNTASLTPPVGWNCASGQAAPCTASVTGTINGGGNGGGDPSKPVAVPTLSTWALLLLALGIFAEGARRSRKGSVPRGRDER